MNYNALHKKIYHHHTCPLPHHHRHRPLRNHHNNPIKRSEQRKTFHHFLTNHHTRYNHTVKVAPTLLLHRKSEAVSNYIKSMTSTNHVKRRINRLQALHVPLLRCRGCWMKFERLLPPWMRAKHKVHNHIFQL